MSQSDGAAAGAVSWTARSPDSVEYPHCCWGRRSWLRS